MALSKILPASQVQYVGARNLIINGNMAVAQRGTLTGQGGSANEYAAVDRYQLVLSGAKTPRITSSQQSTTVGEFSSQLKLDCTTLQSSVSAADLFAVRQRIEGQNLQHLQYGTSSAKTLSATFTITSPKSGIHCLQLHNRDANYSYVREFTVDTANTAQRISVTFPGYTASALDNDTESSLELSWPLLAGSNWQGSKDGWNSGNYFATSNQQNLLDNTSNDFLITGIQLEVGDVATPFEHESVAETLRKCQRYFYRIGGDFETAATGTNAGRFASGVMISATASVLMRPNPVTMRDAPNVTFDDAVSAYTLMTSRTTNAVTAVGDNQSTASTTAFGLTSGVTSNDGDGAVLRSTRGTSTISISAEL